MAAGRLLLAVVVAAAVASTARGGTEADTLLNFWRTLRGRQNNGPPPELDDWLSTPAPCSGGTSQWRGVTCHNVTDSVVILKLQSLGLQGAAPNLTVLAALPGLRSLSLAFNNLTGAFPDVSALTALKMLYLSGNKLNGPIPDDAFARLRGLHKLYLSDNGFTGPVPTSIVTSQKLVELDLSRNGFEGQLPDFGQQNLKLVNFSDNNLTGSIPRGLQRFSADGFKGNKGLCGAPLDVPCPGKGSSSPSGSMKILMIVAIVVVAIGALLAVAGIFTAVAARRNEPRYAGGSETLGGGGGMDAAARVKVISAPAVTIQQGAAEHNAGTVTTPAVAAGKRGGGRRDDHDRLVFIQEARQRFGLDDLLRSSAEVLGSGTFGASYKATLQAGPSVVVKRFKNMNGVGREDFAEHMRRLGRLVHPNLLPVVAYLYNKDEKLLVTDYVANGSLAHLLHGGMRSSLPAPLDWPKRLKIVKGVARGLAYLHAELPTLAAVPPHGHLKSSNVLVDAAFEPLLSDYALVPVVRPQHAAQVMVAYKSPECAGGAQPGRKSDVWSLGILILELLTGKFPANYLRQGRAGTGATDLAGWVQSVVREEWTGEVFDSDMRGVTRSGEGEMVKLLKVGLGCCEPDVARRWDLAEAVARIEEIKERDDDSSTPSSAYVSDSEVVPPRSGDAHYSI